MKLLVLALFVIGFSIATEAQTKKLESSDLEHLKTYEDTLGLCAFLVVNDSLPENRFGACQKLITTLVKALKTSNSFGYPFERLHSVSILYPPDSTFRVFSWQLYVDKDDYRYYGAIQMNTPQLKLFPLIDRSYEVESPETAILPPDKWYGSVYYNIRQFDSPEGRKYLLFGYDGYSFFNKRKIVDVLSFQNGKAIFGAPVFTKTNPKTGERLFANRLMIEYSAEATFRLNYDETAGMIVYDHLQPMAGSYGQGLAMVPDGSYEGYKLEKGIWNWVEDVFSQAINDRAVQEPILENRKGKDIFGKPKKGKGGR